MVILVGQVWYLIISIPLPSSLLLYAWGRSNLALIVLVILFKAHCIRKGVDVRFQDGIAAKAIKIADTTK